MVSIFIIIISSVVLAWPHPPAEGFQSSNDIERLSTDIANSGVKYLACCPTSPVTSLVKLVPNIDDLLSGDYLKADYSAGLAGMNSIFSRSCDDGNGDKLTTSVDSNKPYCSMIIDLQQYSLMRTNIHLVVDTANSTESTLYVYPNEEFLRFLLLRPVYVVFEQSMPYILDLNRKTPFIFARTGLPTVSGFGDFSPTKPVAIPLSRVPNVGQKFFPSGLQLALPSVLRAKKSGIKDVDTHYVSLDTTVFYAARQNVFMNNVTVPNQNISANVSTNQYMANMFKSYQQQTSIPQSLLQNPVVTIKFTVYTSRPADPDATPPWMISRVGLLSVATTPDGSCGSGRGICLVETQPQLEQVLSNPAYVKSKPKQKNNRFIGLDFTNSERDPNSGVVMDQCGSANRATLWIPSGVTANIVCVMGPSFKLLVARYEGNVVFVHQYHCGNRVNDILGTIQSTMPIMITNLCQKNEVDPLILGVSNLQFEYGMDNVYKWYTSGM